MAGRHQIGDHNRTKGEAHECKSRLVGLMQRKANLDIIIGSLFDKRPHICLIETITKNRISYFKK